MLVVRKQAVVHKNLDTVVQNELRALIQEKLDSVVSGLENELEDNGDEDDGEDGGR